MAEGTISAATKKNGLAIFLNRLVFHISRRWIIWFLMLATLVAGLPWFAPLFMRLGWESPAKAIYFIYSFLCHQLPQRSFFLFGAQTSYSLDQIQAVWQNTYDPTILRQFIGNAQFGYKVAWSDRMVSLYNSIPLAAAVWWVMRRRLPPLSIWGLILLTLPIALDGMTHVFSDLAGIGQGFRYTNDWLAILTNHVMPQGFYAGDALGSFNSWMRLVTGGLFGTGLVWFAFPTINAMFVDTANSIKAKFERTGVEL